MTSPRSRIVFTPFDYAFRLIFCNLPDAYPYLFCLRDVNIVEHRIDGLGAGREFGHGLSIGRVAHIQVHDLAGQICTHVPQFDLTDILASVYRGSISVRGNGAGGMSYGYALSVRPCVRMGFVI